MTVDKFLAKCYIDPRLTNQRVLESLLRKFDSPWGHNFLRSIYRKISAFFIGFLFL